ncbi:dTDP-4-dehydrorhamnose reductase [Actinoplanes campanulatus]|uniref:dTDP-4-dehydrorhamnose reductase n=1 Tax=Actinoplanes campanulatus TaxID=113559 RepID=A0A7W5FD13_9ACTN|nr:dTDP-4-dehydrorhamnose reductase [Actinoplanes campanulatus]MBB3093983.1 dTDP-4-dehydrorhamnose reductase [Actinoplanes campanulatus]GGN33443.1 NAD(P)-dependent oxidoreductase [Actinoplanes campanulatus]GID38321.1 NAD(P)-dependent oxidoreductase [Actinoplanes campanulatus]
MPPADPAPAAGLRWLITGAGGMLGRDLQTVLAETGETAVVAATRADLDITDPVEVRDAVAGADIVLNAAAWTNVDGAETDEASATAINGLAVRLLAHIAGKRLIHVSTDYVFDGSATIPIPEDTAHAPINAYGRGKAIGERAVLDSGGYVVRTAWLYGEHGPNFVRTMLHLAATRDTLDVVDDQEGPPTWSYALAQQLVALSRAAISGDAAPGAYHGTAAGSTTWFGLARAVFEQAGLDPDRVRPTTSDRFPRPARRPAYSVLSHARWSGTGVAPLPHWRALLAEAMPRFLP